ncbi:MAG: aquaporin [Lactobacillaceae bacterium]|jgi:aquaporin Z|nr:aquaporin [Lactobacillaceae bacterium]
MRKYIAEFFGTFIVIFLGTASIVFSTASKNVGALTIPLIFGFAVITSTYAFGDVSGGHFNPAISFAATINKRMSWKDFFGYIVGQILGALSASLLVLLLLTSYVKTFAVQLSTNNPNLTARDFVKRIGVGEVGFVPNQILYSFLIELIAAFILVTIFLNLTETRFGNKGFDGLSIGLTIATLIFVFQPFTGASLNPVRALAPALVSGNSSALGQLWVYIIAPILGGGLAAPISKYLMRTEKEPSAISNLSNKNEYFDKIKHEDHIEDSDSKNNKKIISKKKSSTKNKNLKKTKKPFK